MATTTTADDPCLSCGACCDSNVDVDWDEQQVPPGFVEAYQDRDGMWYRRTRIKPGNGPAKQQCVALHGTIGETVRCKIYRRRPRLCRSFPPGCAECNDARADYDLPPL